MDLSLRERELLLALLAAPALRPFLVLYSDVGSLGAALSVLQGEGVSVPPETLERLARAGWGPERLPSYEVMHDVIMGIRVHFARRDSKQALKLVAKNMGLTFDVARRYLRRFEEFHSVIPRAKKKRLCLRL